MRSPIQWVAERIAREVVKQQAAQVVISPDIFRDVPTLTELRKHNKKKGA